MTQLGLIQYFKPRPQPAVAQKAAVAPQALALPRPTSRLSTIVPFFATSPGQAAARAAAAQQAEDDVWDAMAVAEQVVAEPAPRPAPYLRQAAPSTAQQDSSLQFEDKIGDEGEDFQVAHDHDDDFVPTSLPPRSRSVCEPTAQAQSIKWTQHSQPGTPPPRTVKQALRPKAPGASSRAMRSSKKSRKLSAPVDSRMLDIKLGSDSDGTIAAVKQVPSCGSLKKPSQPVVYPAESFSQARASLPHILGQPPVQSSSFLPSKVSPSSFVPDSPGQSSTHAAAIPRHSNARRKRSFRSLFPDDDDNRDVSPEFQRTRLYRHYCREHGVDSSEDDDELMALPLLRCRNMVSSDPPALRRSSFSPLGKGCAPFSASVSKQSRVHFKNNQLFRKDDDVASADGDRKIGGDKDEKCNLQHDDAAWTDGGKASANNLPVIISLDSSGEDVQKQNYVPARQRLSMLTTATPRRRMLSMELLQTGSGFDDVNTSGNDGFNTRGSRASHGTVRMTYGSSDDDDDREPILRRPMGSARRRILRQQKSNTACELETEIVVFRRTPRPTEQADMPHQTMTPEKPSATEWLQERDIGDFSDTGSDVPSVPESAPRLENSDAVLASARRNHSVTRRAGTRTTIVNASYHQPLRRDLFSSGRHRLVGKPLGIRGDFDTDVCNGDSSDEQDKIGIAIAENSNDYDSNHNYGCGHDDRADDYEVAVIGANTMQLCQIARNQPTNYVVAPDDDCVMVINDDDDSRADCNSTSPYDIRTALCRAGETPEAMLERLGETYVVDAIAEAQEAGREIVGGEDIGFGNSWGQDNNNPVAQAKMAKFKNCIGKSKARYDLAMATASLVGAQVKYAKLFANGGRRGGHKKRNSGRSQGRTAWRRTKK
jgi:hypothetical protein